MVVVVSSPSGVILEMRSISMIHHLAGIYADTVAHGQDRRAQVQREHCGCDGLCSSGAFSLLQSYAGADASRIGA